MLIVAHRDLESSLDTLDRPVTFKSERLGKAPATLRALFSANRITAASVSGPKMPLQGPQQVKSEIGERVPVSDLHPCRWLTVGLAYERPGIDLTYTRAGGSPAPAGGDASGENTHHL